MSGCDGPTDILNINFRANEASVKQIKILLDFFCEPLTLKFKLRLFNKQLHMKNNLQSVFILSAGSLYGAGTLSTGRMCLYRIFIHINLCIQRNYDCEIII